jgi:DNA-binding transcriptional regulator GbsR (MarR family)
MTPGPTSIMLPDMGARDQERELLQEVADAVGALMEFWGFKRVMGRVWTLLYLRGEPLSAAELCEQLAISSGAASMTLAELEHWAVVRRSRKPGDRREYFEAETDVWKMISRVMRERELLQIERALDVFERARGQLATLGAAGERTRLEQISGRIAQLAELARLGRALLTALVQQGKVDLGPLMKFASAAAARVKR